MKEKISELIKKYRSEIERLKARHGYLQPQHGSDFHYRGKVAAYQEFVADLEKLLAIESDDKEKT